MPFTGYNIRFKAADIQKKLGYTPKGIQVNSSILLKNTIDDYQMFYPIYLNVNIHKKQIAIDGYNVFIIKTYDKFIASPYFKKIIENKFYFLTQESKKDSTTIAYYQTKNVSSDTLWLNPVQKDNTKVELMKFFANGMIFSTENCKGKILVVYQNMLPGHQFFINGKKTEAIKINDALMGIPINEAKTQIRFVYNPKGIKPLFAFSAICFLCFSAIVLFFALFEKNKHHKIIFPD
jgi:hypothetical protein